MGSPGLGPGAWGQTERVGRAAKLWVGDAGKRFIGSKGRNRGAYFSALLNSNAPVLVNLALVDVSNRRQRDRQNIARGVLRHEENFQSYYSLSSNENYLLLSVECRGEIFDLSSLALD